MSLSVRSFVAALLLAPLLGCNAGPEPEDTAPTQAPAAESSVHAMATCEYNGTQYPDGYVYGSNGGANRCSAKVNGYCTSGPFAGDPCVASGECYATCVNGTWQ